MRLFGRGRVEKEFMREFKKEFDPPPVLAMGVKFGEDNVMTVGSLWLPAVEEEMTERETEDLNDLLGGVAVILGGAVKRLVDKWARDADC